MGVEVSDALLDLVAGLLDALEAGAFGEAGVELNHVAFDFRHPGRGGDARAKQGQGHNHETDKGGNRDVAELDQGRDERAEHHLREVGQAVGHALLETQEPVVARRLVLEVAQVRGQNEKRLDQREDKNRDHDEADLCGHGAERTRDEHERHKHQDCRDDREEDGLDHHVGPADRRAFALDPVFVVEVDALANHDRVIHDNADHEKEGEERDHVERHADGGRDGERSRKGCGNAHRHPEGHRRAQEDNENDEHEDHPRDCI